MALSSKSKYEEFIYGLVEAHPELTRSTLALYTVGAHAAIVQGSLFFANGLELRILEALDFKNSRIQRYSYTVLRGGEKLRWYDPQPHPGDPHLASTFPHHRHEMPDPLASSGQSIKHNRRPAPGISLTAPNLPTLIQDCIELGNTLASNE